MIKMEKEIKFEDLLNDLKKLKDIKVSLGSSTKRKLQRKRSNVFGGSSFRGGGTR